MTMDTHYVVLLVQSIELLPDFIVYLELNSLSYTTYYF